MATEVKIPAMGESISSGILAAWHVKSGDYVEEGDTLYELETDKITSEATAELSGVIDITVEADEEVEIGQVVATIDASAEPKTGNKGESEPSPEPKPVSASEDAAAGAQPAGSSAQP
ncbi:MAG: biotin/lipoyl-containing protein, partial [Opitutales bacterium]